MKKLRFITSCIFMACALMLFIWLGFQKFTLDHLTEMQFLKMFYKDFLIMLICAVVANLINEK